MRVHSASRNLCNSLRLEGSEQQTTQATQLNYSLVFFKGFGAWRVMGWLGIFSTKFPANPANRYEPRIPLYGGDPILVHVPELSIIQKWPITKQLTHWS
jgi:hypothetical protein